MVFSGVWAATPSVNDVQARVATAMAVDHGVLLRPGDIPPLLAEAVVATEDERFYSHHGVDIIGLGRALIDDLQHFCFCQGGSTITEQLMKEVYLGGSDRGLKKIEDMVLALKAETVISKRLILADYLSVIPTGPGLYGVAPAACRYFGRPLGSLDLAQEALLAGLTQAPSTYDPLVNPDAARARRHEVLTAMVDERDITPEKRAVADAEPVATAGASPSAC
jgi:penicillin-binding protein 1A